MSLKKTEIESLIENAIDATLSEVFENPFASIEDVEYALEYLKSKINDLEAEDFEDSVEG
jgi:hypothetical protein